jgi:3-dehydroquinate synthetase/predicted NBD/HSP70 family sugar kinase
MIAPEPVAVFDVGGTSVRSAMLDCDDRLCALETHPAPSRFLLASESRAGLQKRLVDLLVCGARRLAQRNEVELAGVSLGAAIDHRTGLVLGSGPLWGAGADWQFDIRTALARAAPEFQWVVANDLTAGAIALAARPENRRLKRLVAVAVGTGLGMRTIDVRTGVVATSADSGLQGEIGHLPVPFSLDGREIVLTCDCGAPGHLAAFASGRGLNRLLRMLADDGESWLAADAPLMDQFKHGLAGREPRAQRLLDAITRPLALMLLSVFTIDPDVERVFLSGGVPFAFGQRYLDSLIRQMGEIGLYGRIGSLEGLVQITDPDGELGLNGAGQLARAARAWVAVDRRWVVPGDDPASYEVLLDRGLLDPRRPVLRAASGLECEADHRRLVVCDPIVWRLHGAAIQAALSGGPGELALETLLLEVDEPTKAMPAVQTVIDAFDRFGLLRRSEPVLAIGGGSLLDVVGFAASIYRRGVPYVKLPTTLLAMVDAAIGVKTGINHNGAKSRLGSYYHPSAVLIDPMFLRTLDLRQYRSGLAEVAKVALVADPQLLDLLDSASSELAVASADEPLEAEVIERSVTAMLDELIGNLREDRLERLVDIGHAFSPAIEIRLDPPPLHGESVAIDLALTVVLSERRGLLDPTSAERILRVLTSLGLPITHPDVDLDLLWDGLADTRRHRDGMQRIPLLREVGDAVFVNDVDRAELRAALRGLQAIETTQAA